MKKIFWNCVKYNEHCTLQSKVASTAVFNQSFQKNSKWIILLSYIYSFFFFFFLWQASVCVSACVKDGLEWCLCIGWQFLWRFLVYEGVISVVFSSRIRYLSERISVLCLCTVTPLALLCVSSEATSFCSPIHAGFFPMETQTEW